MQEGLSDASCRTSYLCLKDPSKGDMRNGEQTKKRDKSQMLVRQEKSRAVMELMT